MLRASTLRILKAVTEPNFAAKLSSLKIECNLLHYKYEALATGLTPVRLLSCVDSPVCVEAGAGGEFLGAEVTGVRPLPCVDPDVSLQQAWSVKFLTTGVTWKQPLGMVFGFLDLL